MLGYIIVKAAAFDYSKVRPNVGVFPKDYQYLADQIDKRKAVDAALSDFTAKLFIARFDNAELGVYLHYIPAEHVSSLKYSARNHTINPEFAFLPDSSPVTAVSFDADTGGAVPEHPMLSVYLEP